MTRLVSLTKPKNKYRAVRTQVDGFWFDSKAEARRYKDLLLLERAGKIAAITIHPRFPIVVNGVKVCVVELDFQYVAGNGVFYEDVKGRDNALSRLKRKLVEAAYGIHVSIIK